ncbi:MAG: endonuclease NucS [Spirochaetaceae bacterium]|nr:endonuclease NucS [Spirochaetaceae bacterium]
MDEVRIWAVGGDSSVAPLQRKDQTDTESLLEEILVRNPHLLIPGLRLVGRQTPTEGGPLDLLGVDGDGRLVVFELKRGTLSRDAVAQIIDYASDLDTKSDIALAQHIAAHSGVGGIENMEDFEKWYGENTEAKSLDSLRPLRLFLIGLGADERTERMVRFLAENSGMDISLLTFHGFAYDGRTFLARQVEVDAGADRGSRRRGAYVSRAERREQLASRIEASGMADVFAAVESLFRENWPRCGTSVGARGLSVRLQNWSYARIDVWTGRVGIVFYSRAKALCLGYLPEGSGAVGRSRCRDYLQVHCRAMGTTQGAPVGADEGGVRSLAEQR